MPNTNEEAYAELAALRKERGITAKAVADHIGETESWISRRLNGHIELRIKDYGRIKNAIEALSPTFSHA